MLYILPDGFSLCSLVFSFSRAFGLYPSVVRIRSQRSALAAFADISIRCAYLFPQRSLYLFYTSRWLTESITVRFYRQYYRRQDLIDTSKTGTVDFIDYVSQYFTYRSVCIRILKYFIPLYYIENGVL